MDNRLESQPTTARRGVPSGCRGDERLDFHQQRPGALDAGKDGGAGAAEIPLGQK